MQPTEIGFKQKPDTALEATAVTLLDELAKERTVVLCGRNNSGKSFVLRKMYSQLGEKAFYLGPARYYNFQAFGAYGPAGDRKTRQYQDFLRNYQRQEQNVDNSPLDLAQAIAELSDKQREKLFAVLDRLLGSKTEIKSSVPGNKMAQQYISVDGYNLAYQSSGFRLASTLLTCLFDADYEFMLIDEPELGLSPEVQGVIAEFLFDDAQRKEYFPHLKTVILATHSPVFLDRRIITSNVHVARDKQTIHLRRVTTFQELNALQFQLLGNRFETLHLPGAIVLVEGKTDVPFITRLLTLRFPAKAISVIACGDDGRVKQVVSVAKQMLGDLARSPYANRMYTILDSVHAAGLPAELQQLGLAPENVITWSVNGIEHLYPRAILEQKFGAFEKLNIDGDNVEANGITVRKKELADYVADRMTGVEPLPEEVEAKLLKPLKAVLG